VAVQLMATEGKAASANPPVTWPLPDSLADREVCAVQISTGFGPVFKTEAYVYRRPRTTVFWVLRWMVDYLGGNDSRNFIGQSAETWRRLIQKGLDLLGEDVPAQAHLLASTWSHLQRITPKKRKAEEDEDPEAEQEDEPQSHDPMPQQDYCISTLGMLLLLSWWSAKGIRPNTTWKLKPSDFRQRCRAIVCGLSALFIRANQGSHSVCAEGFNFLLSSSDAGDCMLHVRSLTSSRNGQALRKTLPGSSKLTAQAALDLLLQDASSKNYGERRRQASAECHAHLCNVLAGLVEASAHRRDELWTQTQLHQLDQLRSARGYRKPSHGFRQAVVEATGHAHLRSVATVLAGQALMTGQGEVTEQEIRSSARNPDQYLRVERYNYYVAGQGLFADSVGAPLVSVVCDGVHIGDSDWLNTAILNPQTGKSMMAPPQVQRTLNRVDPETFDKMWSGLWEEPTLPRAKGKAKAKAKARPTARLPSQHWMEELNHSLQVTGFQLQDFAGNKQEPGVRANPPTARPRCLVICTDQESKQLSSCYFLAFHRDVFMVHTPDPGHRGWNDTWLALADVGLSKDALVFIAMCNIKWGPWSKSGFFKKIQESARLLSERLGPNDRLLAFFFPQILADRGRPLCENEEKERKAFLAELPSLPIVQCKGPKASSSRFHSLIHALNFLDEWWGAQTFLFAAICLLEGWAAHADELWQPDRLREEQTGNHGRSSRANAQKSARDDLARLRGRSANSLHLMARLMADPDSKCKARVIAYVLGAESRAASRMFRELRSSEMTREIYSAAAQGPCQGSRFPEELVQEKGSLAAKDLLRGHPYTTPVYRWLLRSLASAGFTAVPSQVKTFLEDWWSSLLNSKLVEDANKLQRDEEQRASTSRKVPPMQGWFCLTQHRLLQKYGREEISGSAQARVPANFDFEGLFQATRPRQMSDAEKEDLQFLAGITQDISWPSMTPASEQHVHANLAMLSNVCNAKPTDWGQVEKAWHAGLVPTGQVVTLRGERAFVVKAYRHAALVWPVVSGPHDTITFQRDIGGLSWMCLYDVDLQVATVRPRCPRAMRGTAMANAGVVLQVDQAVPLLDWHVQHGFPDVREECLRQLAASRGFFHAVTTPSENAEMHLAVMCMLNLDPSLTRTEVTERVLQRSELQIDPMEATEDEVCEAVRDTLLPSEQQKVLDAVSSKANQRRSATHVQKLAEESYGSVMQALPPNRDAEKRRKQKEKEEREHAKQQLRVYDRRSSNADSAVQNSLPSGGRAWADDANGRWRLSYRKETRSISWTAIGASPAAAAAIRQMWQWSSRYGAGDMPSAVRKTVLELER
ncbi:unnamed protein product, partial [Effrenium voratum]